jgi:hypothetical protein
MTTYFYDGLDIEFEHLFRFNPPLNFTPQRRKRGMKYDVMNFVLFESTIEFYPLIPLYTITEIPLIQMYYVSLVD